MRAGPQRLLTAMTSHSKLSRESADEFGFFRALPVAIGLGALGWIALAALAFAIYRLIQ